MHYYEVWVRSHRFQNKSALTYSSKLPLVLGNIVTVELQKEKVLGFINKEVGKPSFRCKPITSAYDLLPPLPSSVVNLLNWIRQYYPAPIGPLAQLVLPTSIPKEHTIYPFPQQSIESPALNEEQAKAVQAITGAGTFLLHGQTGSGKTRVYAALSAKTLNAGSSVIVLSPEISLTPQLATDMEALLHLKPIVFHSKMTVKQRNETWLSILTAKQPLLVVGPRSALFLPLSKVGLIVIDEAHDQAYKQEQQPHYFAPRVAARLVQLADAQLIMGTATPNINDYYLARSKERPIIEMNRQAAGQSAKPTVNLIDLKDRSQFTKSAYLSNSLIENVFRSHSLNQQSLLFLNRRGTARVALCHVCGWRALCPHCDLNLTYHSDSHLLICHTCGYKTKPLGECPDCGNSDIIYRTAGTKAIAEEVKRLFPDTNVMRFDTDNLKSERLEQHFEAVRAGEVDILVGTQILAKGLDLPRLTTLGIINADSSLGFPDFTSSERTYQLIRQAMGRIGRGHTGDSTAIIQTFNPDGWLLSAATDADWSDFYNHEINERQKFHFPPFVHLLKLSCRRATSAAAKAAGEKLKAELQQMADIQIDGPAPAFIEKKLGKYDWQLIVKSKNRSELLKVIDRLPAGWTYDIDPLNLL